MILYTNNLFFAFSLNYLSSSQYSYFTLVCLTETRKAKMRIFDERKWEQAFRETLEELSYAG